MEKEEAEAEIFSVWVNWETRVISFEESEGFERLEYATHEEMFDFAIKKGFSGFGIQ